MVTKIVEKTVPVVKSEDPQNVFHRMDAKTLSDRMVESVSMVKTLMGANKDLRS